MMGRSPTEGTEGSEGSGIPLAIWVLPLNLPTNETYRGSSTELNREVATEGREGGQMVHDRVGLDFLRPIHCRDATAEDLDTIFELIEYHAFGRDGSGTLLPVSRSTIGETIVQGGFFVAETGSMLAGCASIVEYNGIAEIRSLVVVPKFRGQGIAKLLVHSCLEKAAANGHTKVYALTKEEALPVFFRQGFSCTERPPQKLMKDCRCCPLDSSSLCKEIAVVLELRNFALSESV